MEEQRDQNGQRRSEEAKSRLRGRNLAVLAVLVVIVILVYLITVTRLEQGTERAIENSGEAQSSLATDPGMTDFRRST